VQLSYRSLHKIAATSMTIRF